MADRYGGIGIGNAGGSGRCSSNGLQTRGVGVTPLVAPGADKVPLVRHADLRTPPLRAVYAGATQAALPFGAVPVRALVATGGEYVRNLDHESQKCPRTLAIRPWLRARRTSCEICSILRAVYLLAVQPQAGRWMRCAPSKLCALGHQPEADLGPRSPMGTRLPVLNAGLRGGPSLCLAVCGGFRQALAAQRTGLLNIALSGAYLDFKAINFGQRIAA